ncbi:major facilitator superfamily MFS_1 [Halalkalicoccus jeotgali B3]|uniref:Major facilitator superfamily MFS_1 n=2 Tax=Halalkalicoccus jeotgali TaxID=413810 RepID=L9VNR4_HALJB|nr:major facilitator superfamily MFS_1 [Halalkalicoccus jeotgali B3]
MGVRLTYPVLLPFLRGTYDLSLTAAGFLLSLLWMAYAVGQLPGGILADKFGERRILTISTIISSIAIAFVAAATSTWVLFVSTTLFGLGTALYGVSRFTALSEIYPNKDGSAIGVTMAAGEAGNVVMPAIAGVVAVVAWQLSFGIAIPLFVLVGVSLWLFVPEQTADDDSAVDSVSLESARYVLAEISRPSILLVGLLQILGYSIWQAFTGFYPTYLIEVKGFSSSVAAGLFALFFAVGILVQPLSGNAYDRIGLNRILPLLMGLTALGMFFVSFVESFWAVVVITITLSSLLGQATVTLSYITSALPRDMRGTGLGAIRTVYMGLGAASPILFGAFADRGFFDEGFAVLSIVAATVCVLSLRFPHR